MKTFVKDLLFSNDSNQYSTSKLWFNICNAAVLAIYIKIGWNLADSFRPGDSLESFTWLTMVVSGILTSNKLVDLIIKKKYGVTDVIPTE
jgi:hypothetical protein